MAGGEHAITLSTDLPPDLQAWLQANADTLDTTPDLAHEIVPRLAGAGLFAIGVPASLGGAGGATTDAIEAIAAVAGHSLAASFVFWGQRTFIEYLLQSPNDAASECPATAAMASMASVVAPPAPPSDSGTPMANRPAPARRGTISCARSGVVSSVSALACSQACRSGGRSVDSAVACSPPTIRSLRWRRVAAAG